MISAKKLLKLARKWRNLVGVRRKRITFPASSEVCSPSNSSSTTPKVDKGYFAVYSADNKRFFLPLRYLKNDIMRELLKLAEEEYGLPSNVRLTLPCDSAFIEYAISLMNGRVTKQVERAACSSSLANQDMTAGQVLICNC